MLSFTTTKARDCLIWNFIIPNGAAHANLFHRPSDTESIFSVSSLISPLHSRFLFVFSSATRKTHEPKELRLLLRAFRSVAFSINKHFACSIASSERKEDKKGEGGEKELTGWAVFVTVHNSFIYYSTLKTSPREQSDAAQFVLASDVGALVLRSVKFALAPRHDSISGYFFVYRHILSRSLCIKETFDISKFMLTCVLDKATDAIDNRSRIPEPSSLCFVVFSKRGIKIARLMALLFIAVERFFISKSADFNLRKTIVIIAYDSRQTILGNALSHEDRLFEANLISLSRPPSRSRFISLTKEANAN